MNHDAKPSQRAPHTTRRHIASATVEAPAIQHDRLPPDVIETAIQEQKLPKAQRVALVQRIGQSYSNRQIQRMLSNRTAELGTEAKTNAEYKPTGAFECTAALKPPSPIKLSQSDVSMTALGDYPLPSGNSVMAMRVWQPSGAVQREDSGPSGSAQIGTSLESGWTFELEASYEHLLLKNLLKKAHFNSTLVCRPRWRLPLKN